MYLHVYDECIRVCAHAYSSKNIAYSVFITLSLKRSERCKLIELFSSASVEGDFGTITSLLTVFQIKKQLLKYALFERIACCYLDFFSTWWNSSQSRGTWKDSCRNDDWSWRWPLKSTANSLCSITYLLHFVRLGSFFVHGSNRSVTFRQDFRLTNGFLVE